MAKSVKEERVRKSKSEKKDKNNEKKIKTEDYQIRKMTSSESNSKAKPMCTEKATKLVYSLLSLAKKNRVLKIGINESIKKLNKGDADLIILAGDTAPFAIIEPVVHLCENKNRTFYFVPDVVSLGKACGLSRPVAACTVMYSDTPALRKLVSEIRDLMSNA
ncbi:U4/U6 small nuclear ribonucleoprotein SNU13 [Nematocida homosporus]|uniref:U4/U6 small nuclear ribonucleoprotein SNU13 n=1 Tax=Nematocida homosporus TaxID=1912981 RepID=UPI00221E4066|nr:U4/U6 small nuclear ribonucleoprotein SNU13 [Nematocida homosporus]KAI5185381.1 U4/U6 small nuclear ribonucleoprotein SNU13 [Nematocida homosporus]